MKTSNLCMILAAVATQPTPVRAAETAGPAQIVSPEEKAKKADALLTSIVAEMLAEPRFKAREQKLRKAEQLWTQYREAQCVFEGSAETGPAYQKIVTTCYNRLTDIHTKTLARSMRCSSEDMGC